MPSASPAPEPSERCALEDPVDPVTVRAEDDAVPGPSGRRRVAVSASGGIRAIRHLERFLDVDVVLSVEQVRRQGVVPDVALVWGRKESGEKTLALAREHGIPVRWLEDGWIRTASDRAHSRLTYSLLSDDQGVYYDAATPSSLESFLCDEAALEHDCDAAALAQARRWRERLVEQGVTKYNAYRQVAPDVQVPKDPFVLVVDQTRDDASVACGGMQASDFERMLACAIEENPGQRVIVRTHPDVVAGRRLGYLADAARAADIALLPGNDNPYAWLVAASRVYAGTSQLGYEALLAEREVVLFGVPFYAGWGLTDDRAEHPALVRRNAACTQARHIDQLFHASHVRLARYCSPVDGRRWTLGECIDHVALQRRMFVRNARRLHCVGITPWKRRYVSRYLRSPDGSVSFGPKGSRLGSEADAIVTWSFRHTAPTGVGGGGGKLWRLEDGFLRSAGLGSDYTAPGSLVVDTSGLYFDPQCPSDLEKLLNEHDCGPGDIRRAARLRRMILAAGVSKYNTGHPERSIQAPAGKTCVLVIGQVEDDESVSRGCAGVSTNTALLQAARKARPDAWIVYRAHPDVVSGNRRGAIDDAALQACADAVDAGTRVGESIEACDELHTMTSLTGFEALMRGKRVVTWGAPFYAGWGLTEDRQSIVRRVRRRTIDELVNCVLIEYPRYLHIDSGEFVTAETMVDIIARQRDAAAAAAAPGRASRRLAKLLNVVRGLTYAP